MADPTAEIPKEQSCFPLTAEVARKVLGEIAADPRKALLEEGEIIQANPGISELIDRMGMVDPDTARADAIMTGATWAHRFLRKQAEARGVKLPTIPDGMAVVLIRDSLEKVKKGKKINEDFREQAEGLSTEEPELWAALQEITKYETEREYVWGGTVHVYHLIKKFFSGRELSQKFQL